MFVVTEINEYMLPKVWPYGYASFDEAKTAILFVAEKRGLPIISESTPEKAIPEWREGWVRLFNTTEETPNSWIISEVK